MFRIFSSAARSCARLLLPFTALATWACSSDPNSPKGGTVVGTYQLQQADDRSLPADIHRGPFYDYTQHHFYNQLIVTVTGGSIELDENGNLTATLDASITGDGQTWTKHNEGQATYTAKGSQITAYSADGQVIGMFSVANGEIVQGVDPIGEGVMHQLLYRR